MTSDATTASASDLAVGDRLPERVVENVSLTDIVRYAGAGGDFNPLHYDPGYARQVGAPGVFAMGMLPAGILGMHVAEWLGPHNCRRFAVRFRERVWPGDTLTLQGEVVRRYVERDEDRVDLDLSVVRQDGSVAIEAEATFMTPLEDHGRATGSTRRGHTR